MSAEGRHLAAGARTRLRHRVGASRSPRREAAAHRARRSRRRGAALAERARPWPGCRTPPCCTTRPSGSWCGRRRPIRTRVAAHLEAAPRALRDRVVHGRHQPSERAAAPRRRQAPARRSRRRRSARAAGACRGPVERTARVRDRGGRPGPGPGRFGRCARAASRAAPRAARPLARGRRASRARASPLARVSPARATRPAPSGRSVDRSRDRPAGVHEPPDALELPGRLPCLLMTINLTWMVTNQL